MNNYTFNKNLYAKSKAEVIDLIKVSLPDWRTKQGFVADGIYSPDIYEKQSLKILVVLSETYGHNKMIDIESQSNIDNLSTVIKKVPSINKIARLIWLLFKSIDAKKEFSFDEVPATYNNTEKLKNALLKIAWINVKKESGTQRKQNNLSVNVHATNNKEILKKQIDSIVPNLIIVCGDVAMKSICDLKILGSGITPYKKNLIQLNSNEQKIIHLSHPSYFKHWGYKQLFEYYVTIYKSLFENICNQPSPTHV
jgi:hypothetical protein